MKTPHLILPLIFLTSIALANPALDEANNSFTYQGKPIHPGLVQEFQSWISDPGLPTTISVDVSAPHRNEYDEDDVELRENRVVHYKISDMESYSYRWLGRLDNGLHVLETSDWGGGSGIFQDLMFVKFDLGEGYTNKGEKYQRLLMSIVRSYGLGDRSEAEIKLEGDRVIVKKESGEEVIRFANE